ncbi:MAG: DUF3597 domain-containing protein [Alphaproteobacteria bacterium]
MGILSSILSKFFGWGAGTTKGECKKPEPGKVAPVDLATMLDAYARRHAHPLHWRTSVVDLLKVLDLDSDYPARLRLAHELGYYGNTSDSNLTDTAPMNVWLHREIMRRLAETGGKVPNAWKRQ